MSARPFSFRLEATQPGGAARAGTFSTPHGEVPTPCFMPVGTRGSVKGVPPEWLRAAGATMVLGNAFHLSLRPGAAAVAALGGLHRLMNWDGPLLTDSGGFQVFSLPGSKVDEDGVTLRSPVDGAAVRLTPEGVTALEEALGPDVGMPLDHCPPWPCTEAEAEASVERTLRWLRRAEAARRREDLALFGIVQGSVYPELRERCAREAAALDLPGYAVGGVSVGEPGDLSRPAARAALAALPADRPRYLMGVGHPLDLLDGIEDGVDLFDCVLPTRNGRNGQALTADGPLSLRGAALAADPRPLEEGCPCPACRGWSRGAVRHLLVAGEMLGASLASIHNLSFLHRLLAGARAAVRAGTFPAYREAAAARWRAGERLRSAGRGEAPG